MTLVEVMVAAMIMAVVLGSVLAISSHSFQYIADMRRTARSSQVLQQKMEDIRLITVWTNIVALNNTTFSDTNLPGTVYAGKISATAYNPYHSFNGSAIVVCVTLTVTWSNQTYHIQTNTLSSLFCKNGLNTYIF